jgi:ankyrin repeat protein
MTRRGALHWAVRERLTVIARELLARGADPHVAGSSGDTPLHEACALGDRDAVDLLLAHDADREATQWDGAKPSQMARARGHAELAHAVDARS